MPANLWRLLLLATVFLVFATSASAHDLSHSESDVVVSGVEARMHLQLDLIGFAGLRWRDRDVVSYDELDDRIEAIFAALKQHLQVRTLDTVGVPSMTRHRLVDNHVLDADLSYRFMAPPVSVIVRSTLDQVTARDHQHLTRVRYDDGVAAGGVLTAAGTEVRIDRPTPSGTGARTVRSAAAMAALRRVVRVPDYATALLLLALGAATTRAVAVGWVAMVLATLASAGIVAADFVSFAPAWLAPLAIAVLGGLAVSCLVGARSLDRALLAALFAAVQTLALSGALRHQALIVGASVLPLAYGAGLVAGQACLAVPALLVVRARRLLLRQPAA